MWKHGIVLVFVAALAGGVVFWVRGRRSESERAVPATPQVRAHGSPRKPARPAVPRRAVPDTAGKVSTDAAEVPVGTSAPQRAATAEPGELAPSAESVAVTTNRAAALRETFSLFLEAGSSGDASVAERISVPGSAVAKQIAKDLPEILPLEPLDILGMAANSQSAWMFTTAVESDRGRKGFLAITLRRHETGWLIDDIDMETHEGVVKEWHRFLEMHPDAEALVDPERAEGE